MKRIYFLFALLSIFSISVNAQTLSGNASFAKKYSTNSLDKSTLKNASFANVDIYRNGKLVANVLTDKDGNFNVKLDTGDYKCVINYAGYSPITKDIKVSKDKTVNFNLEADDKGFFKAAETERYLDSYASYSATANKISISDGVTTSNMWGEKDKTDSAEYGKLTAGEINDFSKWRLWTDLSKTELAINQKFWNLAPTNRYTIQLKNQYGLPLSNAKVELLTGSKIIYTSRSDNTGKAELWGTLLPDSLSKVLLATSIRVSYKGEFQTINHIKRFDEGINTFVFNQSCEQSQNVDIALVVDATSSMGDELEYLKFDLNNVIYKAKEFSKTLNLRFANVFYRDHGDEYLTQTQDFTHILSESIAYTNKHHANGGGDYEEAVEIALDSAINHLSWSEDTRAKILFLVLDAPPHNTPEIREKLISLCYKAAEKGIRIVPVTGSGSSKNNEYLLRCLALATNGTYVFLTSHSGVGGSHIKPSTDSYQVEILNDLLVRVIKSFTYMPDCQQNIADMDVNLPDSTVLITNDHHSIGGDSIKGDAHTPPSDSVEVKWKFYPNPTNVIINIVSSKEIKELYISDLSGKVLKVIQDIKPETVVTVDLSEYATGIYLIRYPVGKQWVSGKIILSRT